MLRSNVMNPLRVLEERQDLCGAQGAIVNTEFIDRAIQVWIRGILGAADPVLGGVAQTGRLDRHAGVLPNLHAIDVQRTSAARKGHSDVMPAGCQWSRPVYALLAARAAGGDGKAD